MLIRLGSWGNQYRHFLFRPAHHEWDFHYCRSPPSSSSFSPFDPAPQRHGITLTPTLNYDILFHLVKHHRSQGCHASPACPARSSATGVLSTLFSADGHDISIDECEQREIFCVRLGGGRRRRRRSRSEPQPPEQQPR